MLGLGVAFIFRPFHVLTFAVWCYGFVFGARFGATGLLAWWLGMYAVGYLGYRLGVGRWYEANFEPLAMAHVVSLCAFWIGTLGLTFFPPVERLMHREDVLAFGFGYLAVFAVSLPIAWYKYTEEQRAKAVPSVPS